jgi:hypothetical protein
MIKRIKTIPIIYHVKYDRAEVDRVIKDELGWVYTGAHYFDDLYQCLMTHIMRIKFNIDRRKFNYSALIRSDQMTKERALELIREVYVIEDPKVIDLCIKRLGLTKEQFEEYMALPAKTFRDYDTYYNFIKLIKWPIKFASIFNIVPSTTYDKYFNCE